MSMPPVTIIIVTLNSERTLEECLARIKQQDYPAIREVLIVDGGSKDSTISIAKKSGLPIKIIKGGYRDNQEARRLVGIEHARSEICFSIDSDNYIIGKSWISDMISPFLRDKKVIASQTLRYAANKDMNIFNRYFGLLGAGDPVAYYLKKADRLSFAFDRWILSGKIISENKKYYTIEFPVDDYPTVGCNGIAFKKSILKKAHLEKHTDYFHTDVFVDVAKIGYNRFAIVKNEICHDTAGNIFNFLSKRRSYMKLHHQKYNSKRRYLTFDPKRKKDLWNLFLFIVFTSTFIEPFYESIRGFLKKRDLAWFLHPFVCFGIMLVYAESTIYRFLNINEKR